MLKKGWTLGSKYLLKVLQATVRLYHGEEVRLLRSYWQKYPADLVVSLVPHFNRALRESLTGTDVPFVTILTDLADYPPHFWLEPQQQYIICGTPRAVEQARQIGISERMIMRSSGMIVSPMFYDARQLNVAEERAKLGLRQDLPTCLVLFGGQGSKVMLEIAERVERSALQVQFIYICGHNKTLAQRLNSRTSRLPKTVIGFTREIPYYMALADFLVGKPGPGSISEALLMKLPVIVELNAWTLPQERYNCEWIQENRVGIVTESFREIVPAIERMLEPDEFGRFRSRISRLNNQAVMEIPGMLHCLLDGASPAAGTPAAAEECVS
jgi:1,2-diacylglycerol 3-beta-galactosyltransferase